MFKKIIIIASILALASPVAAREGTKRKAYKHGKFFQNVKAEHVVPLLKNTAFISSVPFMRGKVGDLIKIVYYADYDFYYCYHYEMKHYTGTSVDFYGTNIKSDLINARYPLLEEVHETGEVGYFALDYDSKTGGLTKYMYDKRKWWQIHTGHLQKALPAMTWELCPEFPSAETLGAQVNEKQTSKYYSELIKQDAGRRIKVPAYEAKEPLVTWYDMQGNVQKTTFKK